MLLDFLATSVAFSGLASYIKNMHFYFLFILKSLREKMMKAFESAGWPASAALHGEDAVMNLFIFFVFADPVDGFAGTYQLEYTTTTSTTTPTPTPTPTPAAGGGLVGRAAATAAAESSGRRLESDIVGIG